MKMNHMVSLGLMLCSSVLFAENISIIGTVEQKIQLNHMPNKANGVVSNNKVLSKTIDLINVQLSDAAQQTLYQRVTQLLQPMPGFEGAVEPISGARSVQLGMNNVPVLDQGQHGSCVTFSVTAAYDAALNKGDYISQLCLLQLGSYLENNGNEYSGWNGLWGDMALERIDNYGIINMANQKKYGCGGVQKYPLWSTPSTDMAPEEYSQYSEKMADAGVTWEKLFSVDNFTSDTNEMNQKLHSVKTALKAGHRVTFGVLLPRTDLGTVGADAWHNWFADTWVLSYDIAKALETATSLPAHELLIIGYDDDAVAMDTWGHRHHGLLRLRNSWGSGVADWGDFYMSYDYFKVLALEAYSIKKIS